MGRNLLGVMADVFPEMQKHGHAPARIPPLSPDFKGHTKRAMTHHPGPPAPSAPSENR